MAQVLGIGGVFFKSADPKGLKQWYATHLGFQIDDFGSVQFHPKTMPEAACTVWTPFAAGTEYFAPSTKEFMLNLIVDDVKGVLSRAAAGGAQIVGDVADYDYGTFGHFIDPDGNKIELWMPK